MLPAHARRRTSDENRKCCKRIKQATEIKPTKYCLVYNKHHKFAVALPGGPPRGAPRVLPVNPIHKTVLDVIMVYTFGIGVDVSRSIVSERPLVLIIINSWPTVFFRPHGDHWFVPAKCDRFRGKAIGECPVLFVPHLWSAQYFYYT